MTFSKIDLQSGYHKRHGDEWKITFKPRGLHEWMVMSSSLFNAPNPFMKLMNHVVNPFIGRFVVVYFDGILVYNKGKEECTSHLSQIFEGNKNYMLILRNVSFTNILVFLGYVISNEGVKMDPSKLEAIVSWLEPTTIPEFQSFHGLALFYQQFTKSCNSIYPPIIDLLKVGLFKWTAKAQQSFQHFKENVRNALVLFLSNEQRS